jgi:hypothetical protein
MVDTTQLHEAYSAMYVGKQFIYKSKYGSVTPGIVDRICININIDLDSTIHQLEIGVMSENDNYYSLNEIYFKISDHE